MRKPVSRSAVRKSQRRRKAEAKKLTEFGKPHHRPATWGAIDVPRIAAQIREHLVGQHDYSDDEIAEFYGISGRTLYRYKAKYPEIAHAMLRGEAQLVKLVERKLVQNAVGYTRKALKIMQHEGQPLAVHYEEEVAPNVSAQVAFLKAKKPDLYRDRLLHTGDPLEPVRFIIDGRDVTHLEPKGREDNGGSTEGAGSTGA